MPKVLKSIDWEKIHESIKNTQIELVNTHKTSYVINGINVYLLSNNRNDKRAPVFVITLIKILYTIV